MKIVITGATGLIGSELVAQLKNCNDFDIICLSRKNSCMSEFVQTDYSVESLSEILKDVDTVVHLAAIRGGNSSAGYAAYSENEVLTENILKAMVINGCKKIIFMSSVSVYSEINNLPWNEKQPARPINFYGLSKLVGEHLCLQYEKKGITSVIFRCAHVLGFEERGYMLEIFMKTAHNNGIITVKGESKAKREFIYVKDVAAALRWSLYQPELNGIFNLGTEESFTNLEVAKIINKVFCNTEKILYLSDCAEGIQSSYMDCSKLKNIGFSSSFSFADGISDIRKDKF